MGHSKGQYICNSAGLNAPDVSHAKRPSIAAPSENGPGDRETPGGRADIDPSSDGRWSNRVQRIDHCPDYA